MVATRLALFFCAASGGGLYAATGIAVPAESAGAPGEPVISRYVTNDPPPVCTHRQWMVLSPAVRLRAALVTNTWPFAGAVKLTKST